MSPIERMRRKAQEMQSKLVLFFLPIKESGTHFGQGLCTVNGKPCAMRVVYLSRPELYSFNEVPEELML